jgi:hypothetical protein
MGMFDTFHFKNQGRQFAFDPPFQEATMTTRSPAREIALLNPSLTRYAPISLFYPHRHPASPAKPLDFG